jgi:hypothetical protein
MIVAAVLVLLVGLLGALAHRGMREEGELLRYRSTMRDLASTVHTMRSRALAKRRIVQLHVDASRGSFQLISLHEGSQPYETLEQTIWLPKGLHISVAPALLTALPTGHLSSTSIVVDAPSYHKLFRLTTDEAGLVRLDEEPAL